MFLLTGLLRSDLSRRFRSSSLIELSSSLSDTGVGAIATKSCEVLTLIYKSVRIGKRIFRHFLLQ